MIDIDDRKRRVVVALVVLVATAGAGYAAASEYLITSGVHLNASDGPEVVLQDDIEFQTNQPIPDSQTVAFSGNESVSSNGSTYVEIAGLRDERVRLTNLDTKSTSGLTLESEGRDTVTIQSDGTVSSFEYRVFGLNDGNNDLRINSSTSTTLNFERNVSDPVAAIDSNGNTLANDDGSGDTVTLTIPAGDYDIQLRSAEVGLSNPSPADGAAVSTRPVTISVDVEANGQTNVEFIDAEDGSTIGTDTVSGDAKTETASTTWDSVKAGENNWYAVATDEFGSSVQTDDFSLGTPSTLEIRDELNQSLITSNGNLTLQFYEDGEERVITREPTDGTIDLEGFPVDTRLIIGAQADGYQDRRIVLDSVIQQSTVYLLPDSEDSVLQTFVLEDRTGDYPDDETVLKISKPIEGTSTNESNFTLVAGDLFDAGGELDARLQQGERYRLTVENANGKSRSVGGFVAENGGIMPLEIGIVNFEAPEDRGYSFEANTITLNPDANPKNQNLGARIRYFDTAGETSKVTYRLEYLGNETVVYGPVTLNNPVSHQENLELPNDDVNYEAVYEIQRGGETITDRKVLGGVSTLSWPVPLQWLQAFGLVGLVAVAGLFGGSMSRTGAVVVVVAAAGMTTLGVLQISPAWIGLSGAAAVLFKFADGGLV